MFMCKGQCVYRNSSANVVPYFAKLGYECEPYDNPADFALDILIDASRTPSILARLSDAYSHSSNPVDAGTLAEPGVDTDDPEHLESIAEVEAAQTWSAEIFFVSQRTLRNALRNPAMALAQVTVSIMIGFLVGLVFFDLKKTIDAGVQDRLGAIFFIVVNQVFSSMTAIEPLLQERVLFIHVSPPRKMKKKYICRLPGICQWILPNFHFFRCQTGV